MNLNFFFFLEWSLSYVPFYDSHFTGITEFYFWDQCIDKVKCILSYLFWCVDLKAFNLLQISYLSCWDYNHCCQHSSKLLFLPTKWLIISILLLFHASHDVSYWLYWFLGLLGLIWRIYFCIGFTITEIEPAYWLDPIPLGLFQQVWTLRENEDFLLHMPSLSSRLVVHQYQCLERQEVSFFGSVIHLRPLVQELHSLKIIRK